MPCEILCFSVQSKALLFQFFLMSKIKKAHAWFESALNVYNLLFFLILVVLWIYFSAVLLTTKPFQFLLFWDAFNIIYAELAFKTGCIFLVLFNSLASIRGLIVQYYDVKENVGHVRTVAQFVKRKR